MVGVELYICTPASLFYALEILYHLSKLTQVWTTSRQNYIFLLYLLIPPRIYRVSALGYLEFH